MGEMSRRQGICRLAERYSWRSAWIRSNRDPRMASIATHATVCWMYFVKLYHSTPMLYPHQSYYMCQPSTAVVNLYSSKATSLPISISIYLSLYLCIPFV